MGVFARWPSCKLVCCTSIARVILVQCVVMNRQYYSLKTKTNNKVCPEKKISTILVSPSSRIVCRSCYCYGKGKQLWRLMVRNDISIRQCCVLWRLRAVGASQLSNMVQQSSIYLYIHLDWSHCFCSITDIIPFL